MALDVSPIRKFLSRTSQDTGDLGVSSPGSKIVAMAVRLSLGGAQL